MRYPCRLAGIVLFALLATAAQSAEAADWKEERERLRKIVENKVQIKIGRQLDLSRIAEQLGLPYPVPEPSQSREEVKKAAAAAARQDVNTQYPPEQITQFRAAAKEKYALWEKGDEVSFVIRGGHGPNTQVEGRLRHVGSQRVHVGNRWIARGDIDKEVLARLDPEVHEELISDLVRRKKMNHTLNRERLFEEAYPKHGKRLMRAANYVHWKGRWIAGVELFEKALDYRRKTIAKTLRPDIEEEIFKKNGYVQRRGEWVPKSLIGRLKGTLSWGDGEEDEDVSAAKDSFFLGLK